MKGKEMLLIKVKQIFSTKIKIAGGLKMPVDSDLSETVFEALIFVATHCIPRELLKDSAIDTDEVLLRNLSDGFFIKEPAYPIFDASDPLYNASMHLQIDEDLNYAVINKAVALYSREAKNIMKFEEEARRVINRYKANYNKVGD